jgi:hypothetical protein
MEDLALQNDHRLEHLVPCLQNSTHLGLILYLVPSFPSNKRRGRHCALVTGVSSDSRDSFTNSSSLAPEGSSIVASCSVVVLLTPSDLILDVVSSSSSC